MDALALAAAPLADPATARAAARASFFLLLVLVLGVGGLTFLGVLFSIRRHRAAAPRRKRQVTSRLSAWDEAAARAKPWEGPDPADLEDPHEPDRL